MNKVYLLVILLLNRTVFTGLASAIEAPQEEIWIKGKKVVRI